MTLHDRRSTDTLAAGQYAPVEVDDPFEPGAKIVVLRQLRSDPLARLHSRDQIDDAQFLAGREYQISWERVACGARAIDPSKEKVDGGLLYEPFSEARREASLKLADADRHLGQEITSILRDMLIRGLILEDVLIERGLIGAWQMRVYGKKFRDALNTLAKLWGYSNGAKNVAD
jgi:hypothetical protein